MKNVKFELLKKDEYDKSGKFYQGYPNILNFLDIDYKNTSNLQYDLNQVEINCSYKYTELCIVMNDPQISSLFPEIHGRMRFIERILLASGVDMSDRTKVANFIQSFKADLENALNKSVEISQRKEEIGKNSMTIVVELSNGKRITLGINDKGLIHTIY